MVTYSLHFGLPKQDKKNKRRISFCEDYIIKNQASLVLFCYFSSQQKLAEFNWSCSFSNQIPVVIVPCVNKGKKVCNPFSRAGYFSNVSIPSKAIDHCFSILLLKSVDGNEGRNDLKMMTASFFGSLGSCEHIIPMPAPGKDEHKGVSDGCTRFLPHESLTVDLRPGSTAITQGMNSKNPALARSNIGGTLHTDTNRPHA